MIYQSVIIILIKIWHMIYVYSLKKFFFFTELKYGEILGNMFTKITKKRRIIREERCHVCVSFFNDFNNQLLNVLIKLYHFLQNFFLNI